MLRKLQEKDIDFLLEKLNSLSDEDKKLYHPHPFTRKTLLELLEKEYDSYFVLEKKGVIVGYSMLRTFGTFEIPTYGQVIWQEYRGKGYGSEILEKTLEEAVKIGFKTVKLKVYPNNKVGYQLYIKHGFKEIGTENDEIWMEKHLS
jgi:ribosomal protein S18 acetylase RimI-like enzyme